MSSDDRIQGYVSALSSRTVPFRLRSGPFTAEELDEITELYWDGKLPKEKHRPTIDEVIEANRHLTRVDDETYAVLLETRYGLENGKKVFIGQSPLKFDIDKQLARLFPILGSGSTALVFDIGTCVLKRVVDDSRTWEAPLFRVAMDKPGLYLPTTGIGACKYGCYSLRVQEKTTPISAREYTDQIHRLYFSDVPRETFDKDGKWGPPDWLTWEWGVDQRGIPHVFDWG